MLKPSREQLQTLEPFERFAFTLSDQLNRVPLLKSLGHAYLKHVGSRWVNLCSRNLLNAYGLEPLRHLEPDRGVVLVSNHRSFFDMYVISSLLLRHCSWIDRMYFPVRSSYFYECPSGIAVNALMSALAMYPPVMRDSSKRVFNRYSIDVLTELARTRGSIIGMHPEGTRNKQEDAYDLLPAQPGVGQLVYRAKPIVLPAFILGLSNDFVGQVRGNFNGRGEPITVVLGTPVNLDDLYAQPDRLRTHKRISDRLRDVIMDLGARERALRGWEGFPDKSVTLRSAPRAA